MNISKNIILKQFEIGPMQNFTYFIGDAQTKEIFVVDPAWEIDTICSKAHSEGFTIVGALLTHCHYDHINGLKELLSHLDIPVYLSEKETLSESISSRAKIIKIEDHQKIRIGNVEIECLLTPGHTPGSLCFLCENVLITGDTLFIDGCGRCDLPGGDPDVMYHTLFNVIMKLPDSTVIYPGHDYGPVSYDTLASQKNTNPYLECLTLKEFLYQRMGIHR